MLSGPGRCTDLALSLGSFHGLSGTPLWALQIAYFSRKRPSTIWPLLSPRFYIGLLNTSGEPLPFKWYSVAEAETTPSLPSALNV
jgi:hypothetical protein